MMVLCLQSIPKFKKQNMQFLKGSLVLYPELSTTLYLTLFLVIFNVVIVVCNPHRLSAKYVVLRRFWSQQVMTNRYNMP